MPRAHITLEDRMESLLERDPNSGCWLFNGCTCRGYGHLWVGGRLKKAHRVTYELWRGEIPSGLFLDHLCRTPACCNPLHLEPVDNRENQRRGNSAGAIVARTGRCMRGHPLDGENVRLWRNRRLCRACDRDRQAAARLRRIAA